MKKILTILFSILFVTSAYSLDFDSTTDECLRDVLGKAEGEITVDELSEIDEFYCYSDKVTLKSLTELVQYLRDGAKV